MTNDETAPASPPTKRTRGAPPGSRNAAIPLPPDVPVAAIERLEIKYQLTRVQAVQLYELCREKYGDLPPAEIRRQMLEELRTTLKIKERIAAHIARERAAYGLGDGNKK